MNTHYKIKNSVSLTSSHFCNGIATRYYSDSSLYEAEVNLWYPDD